MAATGVRYARAFFDLQLQFARKVTALSGLPLPRALLEYTNLYIRFGLGRAFDPDQPVWREYVAGLEDADDQSEWTYRFYLTREEAMAAPATMAACGCFSCVRLDGDRVRLHFNNAEANGHSPLGIERVGQRVAELTALFEHVRQSAPGAPLVVGASWLYNLDAYRRLFPPSYLASARVIQQRFRHMPLWGQFLDHTGQVKASVARPFLERLESQSSRDRLGQCFQFQVLAVEASVRAFYDHYRI